MCDYHMHSTVSFDGKGSPEEMVSAAEKAGLREICFTDHIDYDRRLEKQTMVFDFENYARSYDGLKSDRVLIRRGMEFGLTPWNRELIARDVKRRNFDFVLGSVHFVDDLDVYFEEFWDGREVEQAYLRYLQEVLAMVRLHDEFDVLAHLTYICKARKNPTHAPIYFDDFHDLNDEILKELVRKGKGLEMNTSGVDRCGDFLPPEGFFRRFRELGGEIVTVGSDAHTPDRVGQYCDRACGILKDIFGYVCTFRQRKPVFHKL